MLRIVQNNQKSFFLWKRDYGKLYGSPENNYLATYGLYLAGLVTKNQKLRRTGVYLWYWQPRPEFCNRS